MMSIIALCACNNKGYVNAVDKLQPQYQTYECELFSVSYPSGYEPYRSMKYSHRHNGKRWYFPIGRLCVATKRVSSFVSLQIID